MFKAVANVTTGLDNTNKIKQLLNDLAHKQVYVGIPDDGNNDRPDSGITNAELLYIHTHGVRAKDMRDEMKPSIESGTLYSKAYQMYIHEHGSPLWQSPPRPVLEPAIENSKEIIAKQLKKVLGAALDGKDPAPELERAGMLGQTIVQEWFTNPSNGWVPNAPSTIAKKGSDMPLIDTGELRKSITYVVVSE